MFIIQFHPIVLSIYIFLQTKTYRAYDAHFRFLVLMDSLNIIFEKFFSVPDRSFFRKGPQVEKILKIDWLE